MDDLPSPSTSLRVPSITRPGSSCSNSISSSDPFHSTPTPASRSKNHIHLLFGNDVTPITADIDHRRVFARFMARLEEAEADGETLEGNHVGLEGVDPTPALTAWAESTRAELGDVKKRREAHIQAMYDQLEALWRRLGVSDEAMDDFVEVHRGSTEETVKAYEEELERMLELKRERMGTFIDNARREIERLWDDLMVGEEERADFMPFVDGVFYACLAILIIKLSFQMNTPRNF
jgi:Ase1/PRC1/MAP65 family protein